MATGVPRSRPRRGAARAREREAPIRLEYPGKQPEGEILARAPALFEAAWTAPGGLGNRLYLAENLDVLASLRRDPAVAGKVRLIYIDPPFATRSVFHARGQEEAQAYEDTLEGAQYVEFLRQRLVHLRELLAEDGSLYVHLDDKMVFQVKLILDELFGASRFRNCIVRKKCNPKNYTRKSYGNVADFILFYTKGDTYVWKRPHEAWSEERAREYQYVEAETGRRYMKVPLHAPGVRRGETGQPWRGKPPPPGKHWQYPPRVLDEMDARGEIYWSPRGNPRRKVYLDESPGVPVQDIWLDFKDAHNQNIRITGYPTEKNPELLRRIIEASSEPGDWVLDCFSGSGTTLAVAGEVGRRWIGVDSSEMAIRTTLGRLVKGTERMGDYVRGRAGGQGAGRAGGSGGSRLDFGLYVGEAHRGSTESLRREWGELLASGGGEP
jgi:adenine-specific DNA-methyltransferase